MENNEITQTEPQKFIIDEEPLWRLTVKEMVNKGVTHGDTFTTEFFEEKLAVKRTKVQFGFGVSAVRRALLEYGLYLSGEGQGGNAFVIVPASQNIQAVESMGTKAIRLLRNAVTLGANTDGSKLTDQERAKLDSVTQHNATRLALLTRKQLA